MINDNYSQNPDQQFFQSGPAPAPSMGSFPQPGTQPHPPAPYHDMPPQAVNRQQTGNPGSGSGLATACLVLGIIGFFTGFLLVGLALDVIGIILGIVSVTNDRPRKGMAAAGILIALLSILLTLLFYYLVGRSSIPDPGVIDPASGVPGTVAVQTFSGDVLSENIHLKDYDIDCGVLLIYENENPVDVDLDIQVVYYDEKGKMIFLQESWLMGCAAGGRAAVHVSPPSDKSYNDIPYDHYEVNTDVEETDTFYMGTNLGDQLEILSYLNPRGEVIASIDNPTGEVFSSVSLSCVYYLDHRPVGISTSWLRDLNRKKNVQFYTPYDADNDEIIFDDYEIIVNSTTVENEELFHD